MLGQRRAIDLQAPPVALPAFVRFSLPDALWQYAFAVCVLALWRSAPRSPGTWTFVALPLAIGMATELGQAAGVVEGVFDPHDALAMLVAVLAAVLTVGLPSARARPPRSRSSSRPLPATDPAPRS